MEDGNATFDGVSIIMSWEPILCFHKHVNPTRRILGSRHTRLDGCMTPAATKRRCGASGGSQAPRPTDMNVIMCKIRQLLVLRW